MEYIRISNEINRPIPRSFIEKFGISTKRDDDNQIGQFGSGSKLAPIAALRNGWEWHVAAYDDNGAYCMQYVSVEQEDGFNHVFYKYGDELKPSSFVLEAGMLSWNEDFQIFREAMANALDEHIAHEANYKIDIVPTVEPLEGHFCTFITADPRMMEFVDNWNYYFLLGREPIHTTQNVSVFEAFSPTSTNLYHKGILVEENKFDDFRSTFDYQLADVKLNEERRLTDHWRVRHAISKYLCHDVDESIVRRFIKSKVWNNHQALESKIAAYDVSDSVSSVWKDVWEDIFGDKVIPVSAQILPSVLQNILHAGYRTETIDNEFFYRLLSRSGIKTAQDVLGHDPSIEIVEASGFQKSNLQRAMRIVSHFDTHFGDYEVHTFKSTDSNLRGLYKNNKIYVGLDALNSVEETVMTLVHELDHAIHDVPDETRKFREVADRRIANLMLALYQEG